MPIKEFYLDKVLEGFEMSQEEFIDLCILLGCDYVDKIKVGKSVNKDIFATWYCKQRLIFQANWSSLK